MSDNPEQDQPVAPDESATPTSAGDAAEEAIDAAENAAADVAAAAAAGAAAPLTLDAISPDGVPAANGIDLLADVNLDVRIELGRTRMLVEDILRLGSGSVVELDKLAGDPVDIYVNDRPVARGEVLVLNDNFCVRISEIMDSPAGGKPPGRDKR